MRPYLKVSSTTHTFIADDQQAVQPMKSILAPVCDGLDTCMPSLAFSEQSVLTRWCQVLMTHLEGPRNSHVACVVGVSQTQAGEMDVFQSILCQAASPAQPKVDHLGLDKLLSMLL